MKPILSAEGMRAADGATIHAVLPGMVLMENAGRALADACLSFEAKDIVLVCGPGNNGGDG